MKIPGQEFSITFNESALDFHTQFRLISDGFRFCTILSNTRVRSRGRLCTASCGRWRRRVWGRAYYYDRFHEGCGVEILSVDERHLPHGLKDGCRYHLPRKARRRQNMSGDLISLGDDGHWRDDWRQTWERRMLAYDVSYTLCGRSVLHHCRISFARGSLKGDSRMAQGQSCDQIIMDVIFRENRSK